MKSIAKFIIKAGLFFIGLLIVYIIMNKDIVCSEIAALAFVATCTDLAFRCLERIYNDRN